ncbi:MAG: PadR family transcriptional regulator [Chloroflexota bacterium]|nr:PadR family transcriptional regulator [Chloroflexota bacterium]
MNRSHLSRDPLALTILALLAEQPRHPYEIQRLIRERRKDFARSTQRTLYHAIDRLVKAGLILPVETNREGHRPERTVYQLTDDGRDSFMGWLGELLAQPLSEYPLFTVAISFIAYLPVETALQALQSRIIELEGELAGIEARLQGLAQSLHRLLLLELEYVRALRQGELAWVRTLMQDMREGRLTWDAGALREHPERLFIEAEHSETTLRLLDGRIEYPS